MDSSVIARLQQRPRNLALLIAGISILVLLLNGYGLMIGITNVLPHLFYIPIILVAYFFPRRGILFALAISAIYCGMTYLVNPAIPGDLLSAGGRIILFILIAAVVSILTLRMRESEHRHAMLLDAIPDMIFVISRTGFIAISGHRKKPPFLSLPIR
jgi:membrane-bound ClpP family serine protease